MPQCSFLRFSIFLLHAPRPNPDCIPFGTTYFLYDSMAAMSVPVKEELAIDNAQLGVIFSAYSIVRW